jgi:hypothetical protein
MKALIYQDKVVDIHHDGFPVHPSMTWLDIPPELIDQVRAGWTFDGETWAPPVATDLQ